MPRLTALAALRSVLSTGWKSDELARDTAIEMLVDNGCPRDKAERDVARIMASHFSIMGAG